MLSSTTHIVGVGNQKGGTTKTATAVSLSSILADVFDQRVLLIDMDPQGDASRSVGRLQPPDQPRPPGLLRVLMGEAGLDEVIEPSAVRNLDVAAAHVELAKADHVLVSEMGREYRLLDAFEDLEQKWDWVFIDCPPGLGLLTINALAACNQLLIPTTAETLAVEGVARIVRFLEVIKRRRINADIGVLGVVLTRYSKTIKSHWQIRQKLEREVGDFLFKTVIRSNTRLAEAPSYGKPIHMTAPKSAGAEDYTLLAKEILRRVS